MSVQVDGRNVFTKEMASVFQSEVIECPDCVCEFSTKHSLDDNEGVYECPFCKEADLEVQNIRYREVIEKVFKIAKANMATQPACGKIEYILSKVLTH